MAIKVLLCEDIEKLGWFGDVVEVNEGYARNYLIPQKLATVPTETNLKALADEKAKRAEQRIQDSKRLESAAAAVDGAEAVVAANKAEAMKKGDGIPIYSHLASPEAQYVAQNPESGAKPKPSDVRYSLRQPTYHDPAVTAIMNRPGRAAPTQRHAYH